MPAKITRKGKLRWRASVTIDRKRYQKLFPDASRKSHQEALKWEMEQREVIKKQKEQTDIGCLTLLDWAQEYLDYCQGRYVIKVYKEKRSVMKRVVKIFGPDTPVESLNMRKWMHFLQNQKAQKSGNAINKDRKNLSAAWNYGQKFIEGFPREEPNPFVSIPKFPAQEKTRYVPPEEDFWKVYRAAQGQDQVMLLACFHLAARRGEIFGMKWSDVDFELGLVRLWTRKRQNGSLESDWIPMTAELKRALAKWKEERPLKDVEHVFVCQNSAAAAKNYFGKPFKVRRTFMKQLCKNAGVKEFGFHAIRHLAASTLYQHTSDLSFTQGTLRHKSATTTNRYIHQTHGREALRTALENSLSIPKPTTPLPEPHNGSSKRVIQLSEWKKKASEGGAPEADVKGCP